MDTQRQRKPRQTINLEELMNDPNSFLHLRFEDAVLRKLETYRLYQCGYAAEDIGQAFGLSRSYLHTLWGKFEEEGVEALVDKRWGTAARKRTPEQEAKIIRAKALEPERGDSDLAEEFGLHRGTVYKLLKEHGLQDLHRVLTDSTWEIAEDTPRANEGEKGGSRACHAGQP
jgi:transposase